MQPITLTWWAWLVVGLILMLAELLSPSGFFLFFFGVGSVATALLSALGLVSSFVAQGLVFVVTSLFCVFVLRKPLTTKFHIHNATGPDLGKIGVLVAPWSAKLPRLWRP